MSYAASIQAETPPPAVAVEPADAAPVRRISSSELAALGQDRRRLFDQYASDRTVAEQKWLRNLRQYLGIYDPEIERHLSASRSKAYPRVTRVKCISVLSRIMNLMFPGNERNWELRASPSPDMSPEDVMQAIQEAQTKQQEAGVNEPLTDASIKEAVQSLADQRATDLSTLIDDQFQELGGDQTLDYVALNRKVAASGILYGLGVLRGPFVREVQSTTWGLDPETQQPAPRTVTRYKPQFEFLPVWDFYPDLSAKTFTSMDGYFLRLVMSRTQLRALANRSDFFGDQIRNYLNNNAQGNYRPRMHETELRGMGVKAAVNDMKAETMKYEIIVWNGPVSGRSLQQVGVEVDGDKLADDVDAEIWMIDATVIKADINPWRKMGVEVRTIHTFLFDEDDTSPVGNGLPNVIRDSQMAVAAAARMLLDNASVTCGPNMELNTDRLRPDQDINSIEPYKIWYTEGTGADAQWPAVRDININSHMDELLKVLDLFSRFADTETFVGPATGGDMERGYSEPMRTAAGASMLRGDAALPFKDIVRNFDTFTQSIVTSIVQFNRKFNPDQAPEGDYNVIARGATSLIAKEVRGIQVDQLSSTLSPEERVHVDERKLVEARFAVRDLTNLLVSPDEAKRRQAQAAQAAQEQKDQMQEMSAAQIRKILAEAFKNVAQGQKNIGSAEAATINAALDVLERGAQSEADQAGATPAGGGGAAQR